ncbi:hypothetical protein HOI83_00030 [Candidatus Uhrbacteria bacterium]|jgi:hypothetical protein|nr:hypothetical protein [Candidatus Uhrbacteria bacterium]
MDTQSAKVTKVTEDSVVLSIQDQKIDWPKEHLGSVKEGDEVFIAVMSSADIDKHKNDIAKSMLNSVLNPKS